jgi:hypothetical protein
MYWTSYQFPSLAGRPRAEQRAIIRAALKEHGQAYARRFLVVFIALIVGVVFVLPRVYPGFRVSDPRFWIAPLVVGALIRAYLLWETNGAIHDAVKKYFASKRP